MLLIRYLPAPLRKRKRSPGGGKERAAAQMRAIGIRRIPAAEGTVQPGAELGDSSMEQSWQGNPAQTPPPPLGEGLSQAGFPFLSALTDRDRSHCLPCGGGTNPSLSGAAREPTWWPPPGQGKARRAYEAQEARRRAGPGRAGRGMMGAAELKAEPPPLPLLLSLPLPPPPQEP